MSSWITYTDTLEASVWSPAELRNSTSRAIALEFIDIIVTSYIVSNTFTTCFSKGAAADMLLLFNSYK